MQKIIYITKYGDKRRGDIDHVSRNIAHGLVDRNIAKIYIDGAERDLRNADRELRKQRDRMMKADKKVSTEKGPEYSTK